MRSFSLPTRSTRLLWSLALVLTGSLLTGKNAAADMATYALTQSNTLSNGPTYGTVTLVADNLAGTVTATFTVNPAAVTPDPGNAPLGFFEVGLNTAFTAANGYSLTQFNALISTATVTTTTPGFTITTSFAPSGGTNKLADFGNYQIDALATNGNRAASVVITISGLGALATVANFATTNGGKSTQFFAAHEVGLTDTATGSMYIGGSTPQAVPEPASLVMCGTAVLMISGVALRRRRKAAVAQA